MRMDGEMPEWLIWVLFPSSSPPEELPQLRTQGCYDCSARGSPLGAERSSACLLVRSRCCGGDLCGVYVSPLCMSVSLFARLLNCLLFVYSKK